MDPKYVSKVAYTTDDEKELIESGFEYVKDTREGHSLWRKRA